MNTPAILTGFGDQMQAALGFVQAQTAHVEAEVYRARFPDIRYAQLIPIDNSAPEWIKTVDYYSFDIAGKAKWIGDRATDIPTVSMDQGKASSDVHMAGIGYQYGLEEVMQAQMLGMSLDNEGAMAAREVYERFVDNTLMYGDDEKAMKGLIDNSAVTAASAPTGGWAAATEDQVLADFNHGISTVHSNTNTITYADTVLLPHTAHQYLGSNRLGDTGITIMEFLRKNNVYTAETGQPLTIVAVRGLEEAGVGDTRRLMAYRRSPQVLKAHIPMRHRFLPMETRGLSFVAPGIFRLGGLDIRLPGECLYVDGI